SDLVRARLGGPPFLRPHSPPASHRSRSAMTDSKPYIRVAAGLIIDSRGRLLLGQRPEGKAWPGWWEFPGGKIEAGETVEQALVRELDEELGIRATRVYPWVVHVHEYPKTIVELAF